MGRPRKPRTVLEDTGAFAKDPKRGRARANEPEPTGPIGEAPDYFNASQIQIWNEYAQNAPQGVLERSDRKLLELAVRLTCKMQLQISGEPRWLISLGRILKTRGWSAKEVEDMRDSFMKALVFTTREMTILHSMLQRMRFTPTDRKTVHAVQQRQESAFDAIIGPLKVRKVN